MKSFRKALRPQGDLILFLFESYFLLKLITPSFVSTELNPLSILIAPIKTILAIVISRRMFTCFQPPSYIGSLSSSKDFFRSVFQQRFSSVAAKFVSTELIPI